ncbi:NAD(P)-binding Rossmann-fold containing protein [Glarea lozoyensis ATCC 20868]|uniref:NAD(P)-binding Rossmann-fold containing protein n=1 Tax=Glarea lozoyensis (strain ATCC 20868 / MF5171) TaxID=1116229 RepID=S3DEL8_GLAL2|nr:NAD(P)-binding Rossmann-fold containing protein [Glarea lozoyensis ATCC 20868]EPE35559.1 NAD(P)-binding Rossmann-fold containing protein [Glarea lozoyensis ATCC 20868]
MARLLLIGATGHIGGAVLEQVTRTFPTIKISALLRDQKKADRLQTQYPNVKTLIGNLHTTDVVKNAAKEADIVINNVPHRNEGNLVFASHPRVSVAIVLPVMVYGLSPSVEHPFPLTFPEYLKGIRSLGNGFTISNGANVMGYVHGPKAYYFASSQEMSFRTLTSQMVNVLKGLGVLESDTVTIIDVSGAAKASGAIDNDDPQSWAKHIAASCGVNMRVRPSRALMVGWEPREVEFVDTIEEVSRRFLENERTS